MLRISMLRKMTTVTGPQNVGDPQNAGFSIFSFYAPKTYP